MGFKISHILAFIIANIWLQTGIQCSLVADDLSLQLVAIVSRHGQRSPSKFYPNDPYQDLQKYWPMGLAQLTNKGKKDVFNLGKTLRKRYSPLLASYRFDTVKINSTDSDRCLMSSSAILAGMFPPKFGQMWTSSLHWQPIPVHTRPENEDRVIAIDAPCPRYDVEKDKVDQQIAANETLADKKLYKYLSDNMGTQVSTTDQVASYYKTLNIEEGSGLSLPAWTKSVYPNKMKQKAALSLSSWSWTKLMQRISGGPMLKEILGQFTSKSQGSNGSMKLFMYTGYEDTLIAIWRAMGFNEQMLFDFGATFLFELHQSKQSQGYFVKMLYMNTTSQTTPYELQIPKCGSPCPLDKLNQLTEYMREVDWDTDCLLSE